MKTLLRSAIAILLLSTAADTWSQGTGSAPPAAGSAASPGVGAQGATGPARRTPPTPPPEAVAACSGKSVGASCTFQHKGRSETGSCFTPDPAQAVACKPARPPREEGPEAAR